MREMVLSSRSVHTGNLILVNEKHPIAGEMRFSCVPVDGRHPGILLHTRASSCLAQLLKEIRSEGKIVPVSGYRPKAEQEQIFKDSVAENGWEFTRKYVALPDHSEHQTGLAIDLGLDQENIDFIRPEFPYDGVGGEFRKRAARYGFVERYPEGKEDVTGIGGEPWHFRYVGYPHSEIMEGQGLCLEEYTEFIKNYPYGGKHLRTGDSRKEIEIFYVPDEETGNLSVTVADNAIAESSGNNVDGWVVTLWRQ